MNKKEIRRHLEIRDFKVTKEKGDVWRITRLVRDSSIHDLANMICQVKTLFPTAFILDGFNQGATAELLFTLKGSK